VATPDDIADMPAPQGTDAVESIALRRAILDLEPKYRAVVVLRLVEGYSTEQTARMLKVPFGTVLSRLSRAQQALRRALGAGEKTR
jgi:RNA polymerase sigma-70 factor (ECF subfamily)